MKISNICPGVLTMLSENSTTHISSINKKIAVVAVVIFSCVALAYWLKYGCNFIIKRLDPKDDADSKLHVAKQVLNLDPAPKDDQNDKPKIEKKEPDLDPVPKVDKSDQPKAEKQEPDPNPKVRSQIWTLTDIGNGEFQKTFSNGMVEKGHFVNDKLEGMGVRSYPDNNVPHLEQDREIKSLNGNFSKGYLIEGKALYFDGRLFTGSFDSNGQLYEGKKSYEQVASSNLLYEQGCFTKYGLHGYGEIASKKGTILKAFFYKGMQRNISLDNGFPVNVKTESGKRFSVNVAASETIFDLKCKIEMAQGTPIDQIRLIFNGRQLEEDRTIADHNIQKNADMTLQHKLRGD